MPKFQPGELVRVEHARGGEMVANYLGRLAVVLPDHMPSRDDLFTLVKFIDTGETEELFTWRFERAPAEEQNYEDR